MKCAPNAWRTIVGALSATLLGGCSSAEESSSQTAEPVGAARQNAYVLGGIVWPDRDDIRVCWEPPNWGVSGPALTEAREWAKAAVIAAWQDTSRLTFTGWQDCGTGDEDIRVVFWNVNGMSFHGTDIDGRPEGMKLDAWLPGRHCDGSPWGYDGTPAPNQAPRKACVEQTAIHEFGHALGFLHEHSRPENANNDVCRVLWPEGSVAGATTVGAFDQFSIMNYCNRYVHNEGWPSVYDVRALQNFYGAPSEKHPAWTGYVAAAQQSTNRTTIVSVGGDGALYSRYLHLASPTEPRHNDSWSAAVRISDPNVAPAPWGGGVALAKRGANELDAFYVASNGALYYSKSVNLAAWTAPAALTPASFAPAGAPIATGFRNGNLNVFVAASDGRIQVVTSVAGAFQAPVPLTSTSHAPAGAGLATGVQNGTQLDVFAVGSDGAIKAYTAAPTGAWSGPVTISAANVAPPGAALGAGVQQTNQLDVFVVGNDNKLRYYWASGTGVWQGPSVFPDAAFSPGSKIGTHADGTNLHVYLVTSQSIGTSKPGNLYTASHWGTAPWVTYNSGQFLDEFHAAPSAGVATALTYGASKPTVFFAGINTVIRAWYSPIPNRYTPGAPWDPRPHGATPSSPNEPTRFAPMR